MTLLNTVVSTTKVFSIYAFPLGRRERRKESLYYFVLLSRVRKRMLNGISQESWIRCGIAVVTSLTSVWLTYTYMQKGGLWRRKKITDSDSSGGGQQHHPDEKVVSSTLLRKYCESVFKHYGINVRKDVLLLCNDCGFILCLN